MTSTLNPAVNGRASTERADYRLLRVGLWSVCVYVGLGLLVLGILTVAAFGARLKRLLLPMANEALRDARARRAQAAVAG